MSAASTLPLAYVADDFTGATDALEQLARAGLRTLLFTQPPSAAQVLERGPLDALGLACPTRSLPTEELEPVLHPAFSALATLRPRQVHYKVCSTFDSSPQIGSIGRALEIGTSVFLARFVPLVVGAPPLGRYCAFGHLFARVGTGSEGAVHRLDRHPVMSRHPVTPADESDLLLHLARQTRARTALLDCTVLDRPAQACSDILDTLVAGGAEVVLFDVLTSAHLARIGHLLEEFAPADGTLFSVGSSAVEMALCSHWTSTGRFTPKQDWPKLTPVRDLLVLSGSCSPVTARQLEAAEREGFRLLPLDIPALLRQEPKAHADTVRAAVASLRDGCPTVLHTGGGSAVLELTAAERRCLGFALGEIARTILSAHPVPRLLVAGGDTSSLVADRLGIVALEMVAPLVPGAPVCRAHAPSSPVDQKEVVFKGGQVGAENFFVRVARGH